MGIKSCAAHGRYKAGCPDCLHRSRMYMANRKNKVSAPPQEKLAYGSRELWNKMTEIGMRVAREDQERRR